MSKKKPVLAIILALIFLGVSFCIIFFLSPSIWSEVTVLTFLAAGVFLLFGQLFKSRKSAILITILIVGALLLNRFAALNMITAGLLAAILGLIALNT